jgi:hypothetical protein
VKRSRPERVVFVLLTAVLALVSAGCVRPDKPTVAVNKVEANLVFGVTPAPKPVETPLDQVVAAVTNQGDLEGAFSFTFPDAPTPAFGIDLNIPAKAAEACPAAAPTAAPAKPTEVTITGDVPVGSYKYRSVGSAPDPSRPGGLATFNLFERRIVRNFQRISPTLTSFEVVQRVLGGTEDFLVATYEVNTAGLNRNPSDGVGIITTPGVGEPERGITLSKLARIDGKSGAETAVFQPTTGLLLLPLPVTAGEKFQSVAVDARTGQTIVHESTVLRRQRVDACGDLVDGWLVESNRQMSRPDDRAGGPPAGKYTMIFATQFGGLPIQERLVIENICAGGTCDLSSTLAQLNPDPLPPSNG